MTIADDERRAALSPLLTTDEFRPMSATVQAEFGARSHAGVSHHNDDHFLILRLGRHQETIATSLPGSDVPPPFLEYGYAMLVADGLGEGGSGSVASRVALSTIAHLALHYGKWNMRVEPRVASEIIARAEWFYNRADEAVVARSRQSPALAGIATALTATYSVGADLFVAHVGHSRAYRFHEGTLTLLTRDHTIERHLAEIGRPVSIERRGQDLRHVLTDAVGAQGDHPVVDVEQFRLADGDCVLLCTNGLTDMVSDERIAEVLAGRRQADEQCETLVDLAVQAGGEDNVTVVLAQYQIPR